MSFSSRFIVSFVDFVFPNAKAKKIPKNLGKGSNKGDVKAIFMSKDAWIICIFWRKIKDLRLIC